MKNIIKQCVGIDISAKKFDARVCRISLDQDFSFSKNKKFDNTQKGFKEFISWADHNTDNGIPLVFLMEATGIYYEELAYFLDRKKKDLHVVLPNKSKHYIASLNIKLKNDKVDAKCLSQLGAERKLDLWEAPAPFFKKLRSLTRHLDQLKSQKNAMENMLHSNQLVHEPDPFVVKSNKKLIKELVAMIKICNAKIIETVNNDKEIKERVYNICTAKGLGVLTVAIAISETFGFKLFKSGKQLVSFAGYDDVERSSGTSLKGKTRISKKGNKYLRKAMFYPAFVAVRHDKDMREFYQRVLEKRHIKMVAYVAVQRKLLLLIYTLWKKNEKYDINKAALI